MRYVHHIKKYIILVIFVSLQHKHAGYVTNDMLSSLLHRGTDHPERHAAFHPQGFIVRGDWTDVTHKQLDHTDPRPHSSAMSGSHSFLTENICFKIITYDLLQKY